ncbi:MULTISPECIES: sensor histidine kinase [Bacillus]|uniref:sensor histidine kinase n=1 Tax=Bacillus TaxID=1386 RepID=UPI0006AFB19C|nr:MULTISPECIES: sensor histidine kinase [Bacillus]AWD86161.1 sensor histidine kinase [Bacillus velezensis]AWM50386.1 sensor histidine kinase [Bacillus amyloliquefaciens]KAF6692010.1 sensor histidine kinase [Bacillus sp. EKM601B]KOS50522.1 histidine kinase [Bacillus amyloliquefaciens]MBA9150692.1 sensor histidine kinase [Bacillus sp. EKM213B]
MKNLSSISTRVLIEKTIIWFSLYSIISSIFKTPTFTASESAYLLIITIFLVVNDHIRLKYLSGQYSFRYYASFLVSNLLSGILLFKINCLGSQIYNIFLLIEIIVTTRKLPWTVVSLHFIIFFTALKAAGTSGKDILMSYLVIMAIIYLFRNVLLEKAKIQTLNKELQSVNTKLKNYSQKIQELTISKERTRIAQELHDSLGHYLIALTMNLEFADKIVSKNPSEAKQVINKSHDLSKECIINLREAVALLNDPAPQKGLLKSINEIFENFQQTNEIKFELDMDNKVESADPDIKNCLYKTVQESITNGIKHGNATFFSIRIRKSFEKISISITDNGTGCSEINKSNGIKGIEKRFAALGGEVDFHSGLDSGFTVEAVIPEIADL